MFLKRNRVSDKSEADRQQVIAFKKFLGTQEGREVLFTLMNKYHVLNTHKGGVFEEGQRSVVLYMMAQANVDMVVFDKMLKGELDG